MINKEKEKVINQTLDVLDRLIENVDELRTLIKKTFKEPEGVYVVNENGDCVLEEDKNE